MTSAGPARSSGGAGDGFTRLGNTHLLLAYVAGTFSFSFALIVTFLLPLRARELDMPLALIGFLIGAGSLVAAVTSIPSGALAQRIGPQRVFVLGAALCTALAAVMGLTTSYISLVPHSIGFGGGQDLRMGRHPDLHHQRRPPLPARHHYRPLQLRHQRRNHGGPAAHWAGSPVHGL